MAVRLSILPVFPVCAYPPFGAGSFFSPTPSEASKNSFSAFAAGSFLFYFFKARFLGGDHLVEQ
ncbi:MAG: hypothetical protein KKG47_17020, partial [Proteobacteria bacterium]|nr:hypothetical protein [Pseudomonadota bacterium]